MSNAIWTGVRLKDVLDRAGVKPRAIQVRFGGPGRAGDAGRAEIPEVAHHRSRSRRRGDDRFRHERRAASIVERISAATRRARLVRGLLDQMLNDIEVLDQPDTNYWTATGYRVPDTAALYRQAGRDRIQDGFP